MPPLPERTVAPSGASRLLHGDPVPGNLIDCGKTLRLIDWQCPAAGDPCEDIALFLSPAMQIAYRGTPLSQAEENEFLSAYGCDSTVTRYRSLAAWYHARNLAYCLWQLYQGESAAALRAKAEQEAWQNGVRHGGAV
jgi:thiamine kinase-like enzyme